MDQRVFTDKSIALGEHLWQKYRPLICVDFHSRNSYFRAALKTLAKIDAHGILNYNGTTVAYIPRPFLPWQLN